MQTLYTAIATSTGGRDGRAISSDNILDVKLATPKELGGAGGAATNPEQLFAAGYSACFIGALKVVASQTKRNGKSTTGGQGQCRRSCRRRFGRRLGVPPIRFGKVAQCILQGWAPLASAPFFAADLPFW